MGQDHRAFIFDQLSWLGLKETFSEENWLNPINDPETAFSSFLTFLEKSALQPYVDKNSFPRDFASHWCKAFPNEKIPPNLGKNTLDKFLREKNLPFSLSMKNSIWKLTKLP